MGTIPTIRMLQDRNQCTPGNWKYLYKEASRDTLVALYHSKYRIDRKRAEKELSRRDKLTWRDWPAAIFLLLVVAGVFFVIASFWMSLR